MAQRKGRLQRRVYRRDSQLPGRADRWFYSWVKTLWLIIRHSCSWLSSLISHAFTFIPFHSSRRKEHVRKSTFALRWQVISLYLSHIITPSLQYVTKILNGILRPIEDHNQYKNILISWRVSFARVNFLKYKKPEKKVDLKNSEVYRMIHHMDREPQSGIAVRAERVITEEDVRRVCWPVSFRNDQTVDRSFLFFFFCLSVLCFPSKFFAISSPECCDTQRPVVEDFGLCSLLNWWSLYSIL